VSSEEVALMQATFLCDGEADTNDEDAFTASAAARALEGELMRRVNDMSQDAC
jgi:hypothetical protein